MNNAYALLVVALGTLPAVAEPQPPMPSGWRLPTGVELTGEPLRSNSPTQYARVRADFNGDGKTDEAFLLKDAAKSGEALWVYLSQKTGPATWVLLNRIEWGPEHPNVPLSMGIEVYSPGPYKYICRDSAKDCDVGDPALRPTMHLKRPAISYFRFESASSFFYWDDAQTAFVRVWDSD